MPRPSDSLPEMRKPAHWISTAVWDLLKAHKLSLPRFEKRSGLDPTTVRRWGFGSVPGISNVEAALNALGYQLDIIPLGEQTYVQRQTASTERRLDINGDIRLYEVECDQHVPDMGNSEVRAA